MLGSRMAFLFYDLSPLLVFKFDFASALQLKYSHNILMILGRTVQQDEMTCRLQE